MRGLAKQLKPKLDNPDAVCVYKTSGMRIGHLITRLKGYICEDTDVLHLGTNDISGPINKIKEDINKLAEKMEGFKIHISTWLKSPLGARRNIMPTFTT